MPDDSPNDPMGILLNKPGQLAPMPYVVTIQFQFRVDAVKPERAEAIVLGNISVGALIVAGLITQGVQAHPLTEEMLQEFARQMEAEKKG